MEHTKNYIIHLTRNKDEDLSLNLIGARVSLNGQIRTVEKVIQNSPHPIDTILVFHSHGFSNLAGRTPLQKILTIKGYRLNNFVVYKSLFERPLEPKNQNQIPLAVLQGGHFEIIKFIKERQLNLLTPCECVTLLKELEKEKGGLKSISTSSTAITTQIKRITVACKDVATHLDKVYV